MHDIIIMQFVKPRYWYSCPPLPHTILIILQVLQTPARSWVVLWSSRLWLWQAL